MDNFDPHTKFAQTAIEIGYEVCNIVNSGEEYFETSNCSMYDGSAGIVLFLSQLFKLQPDPLFRRTAIKSLEIAWNVKNKIFKDPKQLLGFYSGWTGLAYASILAGDIFGEDQYVERGLLLLDELMQLDIRVFECDLTNGAASAIPALIKIQNKYPTQSIPSFIYRLGEHIMKEARRNPNGWSWSSVPNSGFHLTGYSHGVAGIATALLELYAYTDNPTFLSGAINGLRYEQSWFSPKESNWPDFREDPEPEKTRHSTFPCRWCHGAAGIGLARARAYALTSNDGIKQDLDAAVTTTLKRTYFGPKTSASMCHGTLGNAELFLIAGQILSNQNLIDQAKYIGIQGIELHVDGANEWINGMHNKKKIPGFMLGLSGIGYYYLRLFNPIMFPSYLLLNTDENL